MSQLRWQAESGQYLATLRNAKGSGNPPGKPYMFFVRNTRNEPVCRIWLSRTDLATLLSQLSTEMGLRPITDIIRGGKDIGTKARADQ